MNQLGRLGRRVQPVKVADLFDTAESTALSRPERYGGVRISNRVLFFTSKKEAANWEITKNRFLDTGANPFDLEQLVREGTLMKVIQE